MIEALKHKLTRRNAILACLLAFAGVSVQAQKNDGSWEGWTVFPYSYGPNGLIVNLDAIAFLEVTQGKETVRISNDEIWKALHD